MFAEVLWKTSDDIEFIPQKLEELRQHAGPLADVFPPCDELRLCGGNWEILIVRDHVNNLGALPPDILHSSIFTR